MNAAPSLTPGISEPMTWAEICELYPDEWVCLVEMDELEEQNFEAGTARVVGHGKTRREPLDQSKAVRAHYGAFGHYYTGRITGPIPRCFL
jgi:hypothetical protein